MSCGGLSFPAEDWGIAMVYRHGSDPTEQRRKRQPLQKLNRKKTKRSWRFSTVCTVLKIGHQGPEPRNRMHEPHLRRQLPISHFRNGSSAPIFGRGRVGFSSRRKEVPRWPTPAQGSTPRSLLSGRRGSSLSLSVPNYYPSPFARSIFP